MLQNLFLLASQLKIKYRKKEFVIIVVSHNDTQIAEKTPPEH